MTFGLERSVAFGVNETKQEENITSWRRTAFLTETKRSSSPRRLRIQWDKDAIKISQSLVNVQDVGRTPYLQSAAGASERPAQRKEPSAQRTYGLPAVSIFAEATHGAFPRRRIS